MKVLLVASLASAMVIPLFAVQDCWIHRKVRDGGMYEYNERLKACYDSGVDCVIEPCTEQRQGRVTPIPGGYLIELVLDEVRFSVRDANGNWNLVVRDGKNYTFTPSDYILITSCPAYPFLEGISIDLDGITTDDQGRYTVFVPVQ